MNLLPMCVLYTQVPEAARIVTGYLGAMATINHVDQPARLELVTQQFDPALVIMDLRSDSAMVLLSRLAENTPDCLIVALGDPSSEPFVECSAMDLYAVEPLDVDRNRLKSIVTRAHAHLRLVQENRMFQGGTPQPISSTPPTFSRPGNATWPSAPPPEPSDTSPPGAAPGMPGSVTTPLYHFSRAFRQFDKVDAMLQSVTEAVASCVHVSRCGIFSFDRSGQVYRLRGGMNCLEDVRRIEVPEDDPLVRWLNMNAHLVSGYYLSHIQNPAERMLLMNSLEMLGAEVILPLLGRDRLLGWLFVGHRVTGLPFGQGSLEELMIYAQHIAISLENALLYEEVAVQKTLAETVLHSIPVGIVASGADGEVHWFNRAAEEILATSTDSVLGQPVRKLGIRLADVLTTCAREEGGDGPVEWEDPVTKRSISVIARRLVHNDTSLGAVAIVHDVSRERHLLERQHQLERASFWTELAAAMSHEVRNPLVAVSTFAQLLPERYGDADFREEFSKLVSLEIDRLNEMIDQIDSFANPPKLANRTLDADLLVKKAIRRAESRGPKIPGLKIHASEAPHALKVHGDEETLVDCFTHLIVNAMEAADPEGVPAIRVASEPVVGGDGDENVMISIRDNGHGIPGEIREKLYSPFCTTKARGIGLGLPIARRTVTDHRGEMSIESADRDTAITVILPGGEA